MSEWLEIGVIADIPKQGARVIATEDGPVAVFRTGDDRIFALENRCPHKQGPLSEGIVHGAKVTCPLHNWVIDLESGSAAPPDEGCAPPIAVQLDGQRIFLRCGHAKRVSRG